jgi:hypothetical protein
VSQSRHGPVSIDGFAGPGRPFLVKRVILLGLAFCALAAAQGKARFSASTGDLSLSASSTSATVQQPASGGKLLTLDYAKVYCSVACTVTQSQNGTAASATAVPPVAVIPFSAASPVASFYSPSNAGSGKAIGGALHLQAGQEVFINLKSLVLPNIGTGSNYSITISSITGTANITLVWTEE